MAHLASSLSNHPVAAVAFGGAWPKPELAAPAGTAADAINRLDRAYSHWHATVASMSDADLARRLGSAAGQYAESTVLDLILHIQAEALQRGADLCLLRDLILAPPPRRQRAPWMRPSETASSVPKRPIFGRVEHLLLTRRTLPVVLGRGGLEPLPPR
jgi:hypothetical protein